MKHKFFTLVFLSATVICANDFAQPVIKSQRVAGGSGDDQLSRMCLTRDGGVIAGGYSSSNISGEKTENSRGNDDYWIIKFDSQQKIQYDKTIGGSDGDILTCIQQTRDGGYILGGFSVSDKSGEKTQNSRGATDYWVVKLNKSGKIEWDKTIGGNDYDYLMSLDQTKDGGYILGGYSFSNKSGEKTQNNRDKTGGTSDYWVVKLDEWGNIQWDKTIGGSDYDALTSIQQTEEGGYILGGDSRSNISGEKTDTSRGEDDYWIVKLDKTGNIQWNKTIGGSGADFFTSIQQTCDGGYILGGTSSSNRSGEKTQNNRDKAVDISGTTDYWVVKLDRLHNIQWDRTIGGTGEDYLYTLRPTSDNGYIMGGSSTSGKSGEKTEDKRGHEYTDYWAVKLNDLGKIQWDKTIGGRNLDILNDITEIGTNRYLLGGSSESGISFDKTEKKRGGYDYWFIELKYKLAENTEITSLQQTKSLNAITNKSNKEFIVYPNPAKDILHVESNGNATFSLLNQSGKILLTTNINGKGIIDISGMAAGLYYLKNNSNNTVQKVVIAR